jgi:hypothetical protein
MNTATGTGIDTVGKGEFLPAAAPVAVLCGVEPG